MRDIRIGNDFTIKWSLYKNDGETRTPYEVTGAAVLKLCSAYGTREVYGWQASGNTIVWTFRGADQRHLGPYQLVYIENEGTPNMMTVDTCDAFCLVSQSCQQSDPSELLMLESDIVFAEVRMIDDELSATSPNAISNRAVTEALGKKVDAVPGKGLSTEDFTTADKTKLQSLENYNDAGIREALNEKQDAIPDLETIREGAQKGATALQEHQDISHLATKQEVEDKLKKKADTEGSYPLMSVGYSADLLGRGESVPAEFSFRASGGKSIKDGTAWIKRLKGNSVVWNQLYDINGDNRADYATLSVENEQEFILTLQTGGTFCRVRASYTKCVEGHTYMIMYAAKYRTKNDSSLLTSYMGGTNSYSNQQPLTESYKTYSGIWKSDSNGWLTFGVRGTYNDGDIVCFKDIQFIDLTKMFGEGNEPTTIEEFYSRCPIGIDMNAYNEGEVIHMTAEGIKSVGDNAYNDNRDTFVIPTYVGAGIYEFVNTKDVFVGVSRDGYIRQNSITQYTKLDNGYSFVNAQKTNGYGLGVFERALPNAEYYLSWLSEKGRIVAGFYDEKGHVISHTMESRFTTPNNCKYILLVITCIDDMFDQKIIISDIMLTLVHSGWKQDTNAGYQPYWEDNLMFDQRIKDEFPDGMKKWDKVYNKNGKGYIVKGTGMVDMGELEWTQYDNGDSIRFSCDENYLPSIKKPNTVYESIVVCAKYASGIYEDCFLKDDVIAVTIFYNERIVVKDTSYTDAASFKAAMAGVPLYYELAEPTIIEYDEPFNLDYKVADFGTEQAIGSTPSAPISADIIYQFNAVDMIREHEIEINELKNLIAEMQTKLNSLS